MPCPSHSPWLCHSNYIWRREKLWTTSICSLLQPPVTSYLFGPDILLGTLFSILSSFWIVFLHAENA
jgi:hypothetical protein